MQRGTPVTDDQVMHAVRDHGNLRALAQEYGWPDGVVESIMRLERKYPEWLIWYFKGGVPGMPSPVFRAQPRGQGWLPAMSPLEAPTESQIERLIRTADRA